MADKERPRSPEEIAAYVKKAEAEAERAKAEARHFKGQAREAEIKAAKAQIDLDQATYKREVELAEDTYHHTYRFNQQVASDSADKAINTLSTWSRLDPGCDITIIFNSPGGNIIAGFALWDHIIDLRKNHGHNVTTITRGMAASMAGILLQAGDKRIMGAEAWLLIHEASYAAIGSHGDVEDTVKWVEKIQDRILNIFAERSNMSKAQIKRRWTRTDWWISSDEALEYGFCDEVL